MLTTDQVRALLTAAMGYDNRRPGELNVAAWEDAANRAGWTFDAALEAIKDYYANDGRFIMPVDITQRLKTGQGQPPRYVALPPAQPASEDHRRRIRDHIGNAFGLPRHAQVRRGRGAPQSAEHTAAREKARAELDQVRRNHGETAS